MGQEVEFISGRGKGEQWLQVGKRWEDVQGVLRNCGCPRGWHFQVPNKAEGYAGPGAWKQKLERVVSIKGVGKTFWNGWADSES